MRSVSAWFFARRGQGPCRQPPEHPDAGQSRPRPCSGPCASNLLGYVVTIAYGASQALSPRVAGPRLAGVHNGLATLATPAAMTLAPGIVPSLTGKSETLVRDGSALAVPGMGSSSSLSRVMAWAGRTRLAIVHPLQGLPLRNDAIDPAWLHPCRVRPCYVPTRRREKTCGWIRLPSGWDRSARLIAASKAPWLGANPPFRDREARPIPAHAPQRPQAAGSRADR